MTLQQSSLLLKTIILFEILFLISILKTDLKTIGRVVICTQNGVKKHDWTTSDIFVTPAPLKTDICFQYPFV